MVGQSLTQFWVLDVGNEIALTVAVGIAFDTPEAREDIARP
jgi:hypothetical protein